MDSLIWKIKSLINKLLPLAIVGGLLYGGWHLYQEGTFKRGIVPGITKMLHKVPYFGQRFRHYGYSKKSISKRGGKHKRSHRRHHRRHR